MKEPKRHIANTRHAHETGELSRESIAVITEADSVVTAIAEEEPLPVVMAEMALWGMGISALMIPIGIMGLMAAPFAAVGNIFRPTPDAA